MMATSLEMPSLYVEGQSDLHTIIQLLARHDISLDKSTGPVLVKDAKGDSGVLKAMATAAKASTLHPVGFVLDADESLTSRWQAVRNRLSGLGIELPSSIPQEGFIGDSLINKSRVGVWIMPDNSLDIGALENLIQTLVPPNDTLYELARSATADARSKEAKFKQQDQTKAELHCWLAWQEEPGLSFGTAVKVKYFHHDSDPAMRFVKWFKQLFDIS